MTLDEINEMLIIYKGNIDGIKHSLLIFEMTDEERLNYKKNELEALERYQIKYLELKKLWRKTI